MRRTLPAGPRDGTESVPASRPGRLPPRSVEQIAPKPASWRPHLAPSRQFPAKPGRKSPPTLDRRPGGWSPPGAHANDLPFNGPRGRKRHGHAIKKARPCRGAPAFPRSPRRDLVALRRIWSPHAGQARGRHLAGPGCRAASADTTSARPGARPPWTPPAATPPAATPPAVAPARRHPRSTTAQSRIPADRGPCPAPYPVEVWTPDIPEAVTPR
jgi:hypothetical protein